MIVVSINNPETQKLNMYPDIKGKQTDEFDFWELDPMNKSYKILSIHMFFVSNVMLGLCVFSIVD